MGRAQGTFDLVEWHERTRHRFEDGARLTQLRGSTRFGGDVEGDGEVDLLVWFPPQGPARFTGVHRVDGSVADRRGSFALESDGEIYGTGTRGTLRVIEGSGTGELVKITGAGRFDTTDPTHATYRLDLLVTPARAG